MSERKKKGRKEGKGGKEGERKEGRKEKNKYIQTGDSKWKC
jgi:hypothetical protein